MALPVPAHRRALPPLENYAVYVDRHGRAGGCVEASRAVCTRAATANRSGI